MDFDIVINNGKIMDGSGNPWFKSNLGIKDGKVLRISRLPLNGGKNLDARGLIVCPGFIDLHSHSDFSISVHNRAESSLHMGLTTMGVGQCGQDTYTLNRRFRRIQKVVISVFSHVPIKDVKMEWINLEEYRAHLENIGIGANLAPYVGFANLRTIIMGLEGYGGERNLPTEEELEKMKSLLEQQMEFGAFGLSTGLRYSEQRNALTDEVIGLAKVAAKYGGIYISHMRGEADVLIESCKELIQICKAASIPGCYSHHKAVLPENWGKPTETMRLIDRARAEGIEIYCDQYCQIHAAESNLGSVFGQHMLGGLESKVIASVDELLEILKDSEKWEEMKKTSKEAHEKEVEKNTERKKALHKYGIKVPEIWNPEVFFYIVYSKTRPDLEHKNFTEVAINMGYDDYWDAIRDLYIADNGNTLICAGIMSEDDIITILKHPASSVSTDDWSMDRAPSMRSLMGSLPHPRGYGVYPKVLGRYVREMKVLRIEEAIRKMTSLPAQFLGLRDRGLLQEGYFADIVVFNPNTIQDLSTFEKPVTYPAGISYVLVNGKIVMKDGNHTGELPGKVLFHEN